MIVTKKIKHEKEIELHRERLKQTKNRLNTANLQTIYTVATPSPRLKKEQQGLKSLRIFIRYQFTY